MAHLARANLGKSELRRICLLSDLDNSDKISIYESSSVPNSFFFFFLSIGFFKKYFYSNETQSMFVLFKTDNSK